MYKISETKDLSIRQVERLAKESAVDCELNRNRNILPTDVDFSQACDYAECNYKCDSGEHQEIQLVDTYNLYYAEAQIATVEKQIHELFKKCSSYHVKQLYSHFPATSPLIIIRALKNCIQSNIIIINKYGFSSYLREQHDLYFLVDNPNVPSLFSLLWYTNNPAIQNQTTFTEIINIFQDLYFHDSVVFMQDIISTPQGQAAIANQLRATSLQNQELWLEMSVLAERKQIPHHVELRKCILKYFKRYIQYFDDKIISTLLYEEFEQVKCLYTNEDVWQECNDLDIDGLYETDRLRLEANPQGLYGIIDLDNQLKIKMKDVATKNKKQQSRSFVCKEHVPKSNITNIILKLGIQATPAELQYIIENDISRADMITSILKYVSAHKIPNHKRAQLEACSDLELQSLYYFTNKRTTKQSTCDSIEAWLIENDLVTYER